MVSDKIRNSFRTLNEQINRHRYVSVEIVDGGLQISLKLLENDLEGYEEVRLSERQGVGLKYGGFYNSARETFSTEYMPMNQSGLLRKLRDDLRKRDVLKLEGYKQLLFLEQSASNYEEAHAAMSFFADVFMKKEKIQAALS